MRDLRPKVTTKSVAHAQPLSDVRARARARITSHVLLPATHPAHLIAGCTCGNRFQEVCMWEFVSGVRIYLSAHSLWQVRTCVDHVRRTLQPRAFVEVHRRTLRGVLACPSTRAAGTHARSPARLTRPTVRRRFRLFSPFSGFFSLKERLLFGRESSDRILTFRIVVSRFRLVLKRVRTNHDTMSSTSPTRTV